MHEEMPTAVVLDLPGLKSNSLGSCVANALQQSGIVRTRHYVSLDALSDVEAGSIDTMIIPMEGIEEGVQIMEREIREAIVDK